MPVNPLAFARYLARRQLDVKKLLDSTGKGENTATITSVVEVYEYLAPESNEDIFYIPGWTEKTAAGYEIGSYSTMVLNNDSQWYNAANADVQAVRGFIETYDDGKGGYFVHTLVGTFAVNKPVRLAITWIKPSVIKYGEAVRNPEI